jgi:branched-chain amino acid transport system substrate-binding protein
LNAGGNISMTRSRVRATAAAALAAFVLVAVLGASAAAQTTTTVGAPAANYGPTTNGNAKAARTVRGKPLNGPAGSGLTRGVTATTVKVGCYLQAASFAGADDGFKARLQRANRNHELPGGRQVDFAACQDDGGNPQTNQQIVQKLVQQDQVFGVVGISSAVQASSTEFMNSNQVPFFGWGFRSGFCGTRWGFGFNGCLVTSPSLSPVVYQANLAMGPIAVAGIRSRDARFALQAQDNDSGHTAVAMIAKVVRAIGGEVVYREANIADPSSGVNFTPFVQAIGAARPNILLTLTNLQTAAGFTAAVSASGYAGVDMNYVGYVPGLLSSSPAQAQQLNGAVVSTQIVPQEAQTNYIKQMESDLQASGAATGKFIRFGAAIAYAEADLLVSQLKAVGATLDTRAFDRTINRGHYTYTSDGGPGQMSFPAMHWIPADCAAALKVNGATASYQQVVPFTCYDSVVARR